MLVFAQKVTELIQNTNTNTYTMRPLLRVLLKSVD